MEEDKEQLKRFTVSVENDIYEKFEKFRKQLGKNVSRSQAIRKAMQALMTQEEYIENIEGDVVGCITLIMTHEHFKPFTHFKHQHSHDSEDDHHLESDSEEILEKHYEHAHDLEHIHEHDFSSKPIYASVHQTDLILSNDIQHHFGDVIISTMHVHLEFEKCLEIIAVSGPYKRVKALKDNLQKLKSVLSVGFFIVDKKVK
ncbi:MAG: CopG family ribbon-helix-helix protein [Promethearchaeota archaeon]